MSRKYRLRKETRGPWIVLGVLAATIAAMLVVKMRLESSRMVNVRGLTAATVTVAAAPVSASPPSMATRLHPGPASSSEEQLDRLLAEGQPVLAFFHSMTCTPCIQMDEIVKVVHPEYRDKVSLVDVNVYDKGNQNLLRRANVRVIPTLVFIDRNGAARAYSGVMSADALRKQLKALAGGG